MNLLNIDLQDLEISESELFLKAQNNYYQILVELIEKGSIPGGHKITSQTCLSSHLGEILKDQNFLTEIEETMNITTEQLELWPDEKDKYHVIHEVVQAYQDQGEIYTKIIEKYNQKKKSLNDVLNPRQDGVMAVRKSILNIERIFLMMIGRVFYCIDQREEMGKFQVLCETAEADLNKLRESWNFFDSNRDYSEKVFYTLKDNIKKAVSSITEAARQWNITLSVFGHDPEANTEIFNLNIADEKYEKVREIFSDFCEITTEIGETKFDNNEGGLSEQWTDFQDQLQFNEKERKFNNDAMYIQNKDLIPEPVDKNNTKVLSTAARFIEDIDDKAKRETKPTNIDACNTQYAAVIKFLQEAISSAEKILNKVPVKRKGHLENALEDINQEVVRGWEILATVDGGKQDRENLDSLIQIARGLKDSLRDKLDEFDDMELLQKQLPKGSFAIWNTEEPEDYLTFRQLMRAQLPALIDDTLKASTIKSKIIGRNSADILKEIQNLDKEEAIWERLDKIYGNTLIQLSNMENKLKKLKEFPEDFRAELKNAQELISYIRVCKMYGAEESLTTSFTVKYANRLNRDNALRLLRTRGNPDEIIRVLEEVLDEDHELVNISCQ